jgi:hypothetical protein
MRVWLCNFEGKERFRFRGRVSRCEAGEPGSAGFELRCQERGTKCLVKPVKWHKDHTQGRSKGPFARSETCPCHP